MDFSVHKSPLMRIDNWDFGLLKKKKNCRRSYKAYFNFNHSIKRSFSKAYNINKILFFSYSYVFIYNNRKIITGLLKPTQKCYPFKVNFIIRRILYIKQSYQSAYGRRSNLTCILMLLSVVRKSDVTGKLLGKSNKYEWKGIINYNFLEVATEDAVDEVRKQGVYI